MERTTASAYGSDLEVNNMAITIIAGAQFCVSLEEHELILNGFPIGVKLAFLTSKKGLPIDSHTDIVKKAQELTPRRSGSTPPHSHGGGAPMPPLLSSKYSALTTEEKSRDQQTIDIFVKKLERGSTFGELLIMWQSNFRGTLVNFRIYYIFLVVIFAFSFPIRLVSELYNLTYSGVRFPG